MTGIVDASWFSPTGSHPFMAGHVLGDVWRLSKPSSAHVPGKSNSQIIRNFRESQAGGKKLSKWGTPTKCSFPDVPLTPPSNDTPKTNNMHTDTSTSRPELGEQVVLNVTADGGPGRSKARTRAVECQYDKVLGGPAIPGDPCKHRDIASG